MEGDKCPNYMDGDKVQTLKMTSGQSKENTLQNYLIFMFEYRTDWMQRPSIGWESIEMKKSKDWIYIWRAIQLKSTK